MRPPPAVRAPRRLPWQVLVLALAALSACRPPHTGPILAAGAVPISVQATQDWQTGGITSPRLARARIAHVRHTRRALAARHDLEAGWPAFRLMGAFGLAPPNWRSGAGSGYPGIALTTAATGIPPEDTVPNGAAAGPPGAPGRPLYFLTRGGRVVRVDADAPRHPPAGTPPVALNLADSFSDTSLCINAAGTRLYALSDSGRLHLIDAERMTVLNANKIVENGASARHLAPCLDPVLSAPDGTQDVLYVPLNNGRVYQYTIVGAGAAIRYDPPTRHDVAVRALPLRCETACGGYGPTDRLAAPLAAVNGRLLVGDTQGVLHDFDTASGREVASYALSSTAGIMAPAALEVADGSPRFAAMTTPSGEARTPALDEPVHAFVSVLRENGPACAWVNLVSRTVTFSRPVFVDDAETDPVRRVRGSAHDYAYSFSSGTGVVRMRADTALGDAVNVSLGAGEGATHLTTPLQPATTNARGGTVTCFLRFSLPPGSALPPRAVVTQARLTLTADATTTTYPPRVYRTGSHERTGSTGQHLRGTATLWSASGPHPPGPLTHPVLFEAARPDALAGSTDAQTPFPFLAGTAYDFDVTALLGGPVRQSDYAFALAYGALPEGHTVHHEPPGDLALDGITTFRAPRFRNPRTTTNRNDMPRLELSYRALADAPPALVPRNRPLIDAVRQRVYVYDHNHLFCLKYTGPEAWADASFTPLNPTGGRHTTYHAAYHGREAGAKDGSGYLRSLMDPVAAFDFSAIYVLSHRTQAGRAHLALSKIDLSTSRSGDPATHGDLGGAEQGGTDATTPAVATTVANTFTQGTQGVVWPPQVSRHPVLSPYERAEAAGGALYLALQQEPTLTHLYRFGTE